MHGVRTHTHSRQKAKSKCRHSTHTSHYTQITGQIDVQSSKRFYKWKKHFSELKREEKNIIEACGFITIKMTNCMGGTAEHLRKMFNKI